MIDGLKTRKLIGEGRAPFSEAPTVVSPKGNRYKIITNDAGTLTTVLA